MDRDYRTQHCHCQTCDRWFHFMGIAAHRAAHRRKKERCTITYLDGRVETYYYDKEVFMLRNGNFSEGWENLPPVFNLINQQPLGWHLEWLGIGDELYDDPKHKATGVPECVHKLWDQLPSNEQPGGKDELILSGTAVYKIFSFGAAFGAQLSQTVTGLEPGSTAVVIVPIQMHHQGGTDPYGAESGVWVNDTGQWANLGDMGDRQWFQHRVETVVPTNGRIEIVIRVKSKWPRPKDFFIDDVRIFAESATTEPETETVVLSVPSGIHVTQDQSLDDTRIHIELPLGVELKVVEQE